MTLQKMNCHPERGRGELALFFRMFLASEVIDGYDTMSG
jgi:hypothetical protein